MSTFATAVSGAMSNGGIDMWNVVLLIATDQFGNSVTIDQDKIQLAAFTENGARVSRKILIDETPPCLSVAVDDLLKSLAHTKPT